MRVIITWVVGLLLVALVPALGSPAYADTQRDHPEVWRLPAAARSAPVAARSDVARRAVVLTAANRANGFPKRTEPYLRLKRVEFDLYLDDRDFYGEASLTAESPDDYPPTVFWSVGTVRGNTCEVKTASLFDSFYTSDYVNTREDFPDSRWGQADCAVAELREPDNGVLVDAFVARLRDVVPKLTLKPVRLLGSKKIGLVRGVWTTLDVVVKNSGPVEAVNVRVAGGGKGLKVRGGKVQFPISSGSNGYAQVTVKRTRTLKRTTLELVAKNDAAQTKRTTTVRGVKAPARPRKGKYRNKLGSVHFTIKAGKVRGFRVRTMTRCGTYLDPTYSVNTYDFPTTKIPRNGIVNRSVEKRLYEVSLAFKISAGKVTRGRFSYGGPNLCQANERFTAKR